MLASASNSRWIGALCFVGACAVSASAHSAVIRVPQDAPGIAQAIAAAANGDTVLVARGTYGGGLTLSGKTITLASNYILTNDPDDVAQTILGSGDPILTVQSNVGSATTIAGLTFQNGGYHLVNFARRMTVRDCRFLGGDGDQLSFEDAGGLVANCFFDNAGDDGIDVDNVSDPTIVNNVIQGAGDDGIEIRFQPYTGSLLRILVANNHISGCAEDGIQLIDYAGSSSRFVRIERNVVVNNADVGLGCMADGNTTENFAGAPMVEEVQVVNNTFSGNPYGLTGGDNMLVMNNIVVNASQVGIKRVAAASLVTYASLWNNGANHTGSNVNAATLVLQDPMLDPSNDLQSGSPCIDAGAASLVWNGSTVSAPAYSGPSPDLGGRAADGSVVVPPRGSPASLEIGRPAPNPAFGGPVTIAFNADAAQDVTFELLDVMGRSVGAVAHRRLEAGRSAIQWEAPAPGVGLYFVRIRGAHGQAVRSLVVLRR